MTSTFRSPLANRTSGMRSGRSPAESALESRRPHTEKWGLTCTSKWWRGRDLNPRPSGYEPDELPDCSTPRRAHDGSSPARWSTAGRPRLGSVAAMLRWRSTRRRDGDAPPIPLPPGPDGRTQWLEASVTTLLSGLERVEDRLEKLERRLGEV